jgi:tRNA pseudouridine55 synthase
MPTSVAKSLPPVLSVRSRADIESVLARFTGEIEQVPPAFSAIKVDGQRAYDLARAGQDVEIKSRKVRIENLRLMECPDTGHTTFEVTCSKGTYVRSLGQDIARALGTEGHLSSCGAPHPAALTSLARLRRMHWKAG